MSNQKNNNQVVAINSAFVGMGKALCWAYNDETHHNAHAITKQEAAAAGTSEGNFKIWVDAVAELLDVCAEYNALTYDKGADDSKREAAFGAIFAQWRKVLLAGEENRSHKTMWMCKGDAVRLAGFAHRFIKTEMGQKPGVARPKDFRKLVETFIGVKMSGDGQLPKEDCQVITDYLKACRAIESAEKALNDHNDSNGKVVYGLRSKLTKLEATKAEAIAELTELGIAEEQAVNAKSVKRIQTELDALTADIKSAEGRLKRGTEKCDKNETKYGEIIAKLNLISDDDFSPESFIIVK